MLETLIIAQIDAHGQEFDDFLLAIRSMSELTIFNSFKKRLVKKFKNVVLCEIPEAHQVAEISKY